MKIIAPEKRTICRSVQIRIAQECSVFGPETKNSSIVHVADQNAQPRCSPVWEDFMGCQLLNFD